MSSLIQSSDFSPEIPGIFVKVLTHHDAVYHAHEYTPFRTLSRKDWRIFVGWVGGLLEYAVAYSATAGWYHRQFSPPPDLPSDSKIAWIQGKTAVSRQHLVELQCHGITGLSGLCLALLKCMPRLSIDGHYRSVNREDEVKTTKAFIGDLVGFIIHAGWEQISLGDQPCIPRDHAMDALNWANEMRPAIIAALRREALLQGAKDVV